MVHATLSTSNPFNFFYMFLQSSKILTDPVFQSSSEIHLYNYRTFFQQLSITIQRNDETHCDGRLAVMAGDLLRGSVTQYQSQSEEEEEEETKIGRERQGVK